MASKKGASKKSTQNSGKADGRKQNKGRVENLKPFPKGVSGNPGGRPRSELLSDAYRKYLALPPNPEFVEHLSDWGEVPQTNAELIAARAMLDAANGVGDARREIARATEGDTLKVSGEVTVKGYVGISPDDWDDPAAT